MVPPVAEHVVSVRPAVLGVHRRSRGRRSSLLPRLDEEGLTICERKEAVSTTRKRGKEQGKEGTYRAIERPDRS